MGEQNGSGQEDEKMDWERLRKNFEGHGFCVSFFETKEEASDYIFSQLEGEKIAIGGSVTVQEMGIAGRLAERNEVIWHWDSPGRETLLRAREARIYLTSVNAASETGELVNIDGTGNRVSQTLFGPERVYYIIGTNKLCPDLLSAVNRAKNVAAPKNAARLKAKTPCVTTGKCMDCSSPGRICRSTVIVERPSVGMEAEVIFVGEELGY